MKKNILVISLILFLSVGVFAEVSTSVSDSTQNYIKEFVKKQGIDESKVKQVTEVDQAQLPDNVEIKKIDQNKVGIYSVNYSENEQEKNVYIVTYSTPKIAQTPTTTQKSIQNYFFGYSGESTSSEFLTTATSPGSYVMLRSGSITGISTSLELAGDGYVEIIIYKNNEDTGFRNKISTDDSQKTDYDLQSENIITYEPGDEISVYVQKQGAVAWSNVNTIVETTIQ